MMMCRRGGVTHLRGVHAVRLFVMTVISHLVECSRVVHGDLSRPILSFLCHLFHGLDEMCEELLAHLH